ncbi:MAG: sialidase family protein [Ectothiorhodospiraceae bacterium]|jgi:hypothetical protein|nr:sialidase family protein [Ectothiorhodospiraceae bacterium]
MDFRRRLLAGLWLAALFSSAAPAAEPPSAGTNLTPMLAATAPWTAALDAARQPWLMHYGPDGELIVLKPDGDRRTLVRPADGHRPSGLSLGRQDEGMGLLWRDTAPSPGLYFLDAGSADGPRHIESPAAPLTRMQVAQTDRHRLFLWYGEDAKRPQAERYQIFVRREGNTPDTVETHAVLPGFYPQWIVDADGSVGVFTWTGGGLQEMREVVMRRLDPDAGEFGPLRKVADTGRVTPIFQSFRSGARWFVVWVGQYGQGGAEFLLQGAWSDDRGETWQDFAFESLRGLDVTHLSTATDHQGHLLLAVSGSYRFREPGAREDIYLLRSADNGRTWEAPLRPRPESARRFHARNPNLAFGHDGRVLLAWEDWRTIRPAIHAARSDDAGKSWHTGALTIAGPDTNDRLAPQRDALFATDRGFTLIVERFEDTLTGKTLVRHDVAPDTPCRLPAQAATETMLRARVERYWQAMQDGDYGTTYTHLDPFFRARWTEANYRQRMGLIRYHDLSIEDVHVEGPIADVRLRMKASVPEFVRQGQRLSQPERDIDMTERWLWVDGNWHREMIEESSETRYTQY